MYQCTREVINSHFSVKWAALILGVTKSEEPPSDPSARFIFEKPFVFRNLGELGRALAVTLQDLKLNSVDTHEVLKVWYPATAVSRCILRHVEPLHACCHLLWRWSCPVLLQYNYNCVCVCDTQSVSAALKQSLQPWLMFLMMTPYCVCMFVHSRSTNENTEQNFTITALLPWHRVVFFVHPSFCILTYGDQGFAFFFCRTSWSISDLLRRSYSSPV